MTALYTLLIVDDEYPARQMMRMMIDALPDYTVAGEAENGRQALSLYRSLRPDIVLTDIEMPVMNGLDLIEAIKAERPDQPVIILSCYESFVFAQRAMRSGVRSYLIKDMTDQAALEACLNETIGIFPASTSREDGFESPEKSDTFDKLRRINPAGSKNVEAITDRLFVSFFKHEAENCLNELKRLYQFNVSGMLQYRFLQYINTTLIGWLRLEMEQYILPATELFGRTVTPETQLESCASPNEMYGLLSRWISGWFQLAEDKQLISLRTKKIILYIVDHYAEEISLNDIAGELYVHPVHISRSYKAETNVNFTATVNTLRIEKAKLMLAMGNRKVNEIAYEVGFSSPQGFYSAFKKQTGLSPTDYSCNI